MNPCQDPLDRYEKYKTAVIRPKPLETGQDNGVFTYVAFSWRDSEPRRGEYATERVREANRSAGCPVLVLKPDKPAWAGRYAEREFAAFVRKVGSQIDADSRLVGVVITTMADSREEWNAYLDAFRTTPLLADLHHDKLIRYLQEQGRPFGLRVTCNDRNRIDCCESFARLNLQDTWKRSPVILHLADEECGPRIRSDAWRWHAAMADRDIGLGYRLSLRRLTYPETVFSGGSLPLRFWFVNEGSARVYPAFKLSLQLRQLDRTYDIPIHADTASWRIGDLVHNEIAPLPELHPGIYRVGIGLTSEDRSPLQLHIEGRGADGYYELGTVNVELADEDPYARIWDTYYPEGYYPLEDPKAPVQEQ